MRQLASLGALALVVVGLALPGAAQALPIAQFTTPVPTVQGPLVPAPATPFAGFQATPTAGLPFTTSTPVTRPNLAATATAAAATITAADVTATANVAAPQTAVAQTATALAIPTRTLTPAPSPTVGPTLVPSPTAALTPPPTAPPSPTSAPTAAPTVAPPSPTPDPLPLARTVLTRAPIAVGDETIPPGAALQIPLELMLVDGSIPPGTTVRLPSGQVVTLPPAISIPAENVPSIAAGPVNGILPRASLVGDESFPQGTAVVVPSGTGVLGTLNTNEPVVLEPGTVVQVGGRTVTLNEPLLLTVSAIPVAAPAQLPPTGEADPVLWPAGLGLLMLLGGWRLRRLS